MTIYDIKVSRVRDVTLPTRGTPHSAGIDFYVPNDFKETSVRPGASILIPTGVKVAFPHGHMLTAYNKSGICTKTGLMIGAEVIDSDYQGEVHIHLINSSKDEAVIKPGMKIAQFILSPIELCNITEVPIESLYTEDTIRGEGGFGSTGV